jgi:hypothetical protein
MVSIAVDSMALGLGLVLRRDKPSLNLQEHVYCCSLLADLFLPVAV